MEADATGVEAAPPHAAAHGQRTALVTGGTDGIGKAIAQMLAGQGIGVVVVGSNADKGAAAVRELRRLSGNDQVEFLQADLSLIRNVDALAGRFRSAGPGCTIWCFAPGSCADDTRSPPRASKPISRSITSAALPLPKRCVRTLRRAASPATRRESWSSAALRRTAKFAMKTSTSRDGSASCARSRNSARPTMCSSSNWRDA